MVGRAQIRMIVWIMSYSVLFVFLYQTWASKLYNEFGLVNNAASQVPLFFASFLLFFLAMTLPARITKYSHFFGAIVFLVVLVPSLLISAMQGYDSFNVYFLQIALAASFILIMKIPHKISFRLARPNGSGTGGTGFYLVFSILYLLLTSVVVISYWNFMSFATIEGAGTKRILTSEANAGAIANYFVNWLGYVFNPFLLAIGLLDPKKRWLIGVALVGILVVYSVNASRITLISFVVMVLFHYFSTSRGYISVSKLAFGMTSIMVVITLILFVYSFSLTGGLLTFTSQIYMRALAIQGAMTGVYADFFASNDLTYGSHINGINLVIQYPYGESLGYVIGRHLFGGDGFGANAHFWATDGLAAFGIFGVVLIGALIGIVLIFANSIVPARNLKFAATVSLPFLMSLANASFFTSLITGGGLIVAIFIFFGAPRVATASGRL